MTETTKPCARGCGLHNQHLTDCDGTRPSGRKCNGCLPRRAAHGNLCWPCHRRLELMLHDAPTVEHWLTANLAKMGSQAPEQDKIKNTSWESSEPLRLALLDKRDELRLLYAETVDRLIEERHLTPTRADITADAKRIENWLEVVENWPDIDVLWDSLAEIQGEAHALAPWRPALKRIAVIPCPECAETQLAVYGGEDDVTCLACRNIIPAERYPHWEYAWKVEQGIEVA